MLCADMRVVQDGDPIRIHLRGACINVRQRDGSPEQFKDRVQFFGELVSPAKWYTYLPGLGKYAPIERSHARFDQALVSFYDQQ